MTGASHAKPKPMAGPIKLIVFDFDGTLVDSQHVIVEGMQAAFAAYGLAPPRADAIRRTVGLRLVESMAQLAPGLDPLQHEALAHAYRDAHQQILARQGATDVLFPGVPAMLTALRDAGFVLGIATGKSQRGLRASLERHGLTELFTTLQTADVPPGKPHPAMLLRALDEARVAPAEAVMVGDTTYDIEMARAAGVLPIGVGWGYHGVEELRAAGAGHLVASCAEIPPLLATLIQAGATPAAR
ncbi:MAG: HAD-IA family hydrolase [Alphaproteobacteria bacterium]|nr:HAD-IA family hydrolase [Alphaproteobacteria bacterium]